MRNINDLTQAILNDGMIVNIPNGSNKNTIEVVTALLKGGVRVIAVDTRSPEGIQIIERCASRFKGQLVISADHILDSYSARETIIAGADIVSTPYLIRDVFITCNRYGKVCIPGALTATEVLKAIEWGGRLVKLYPADLFGPGLLKAIKNPLPQANLIPSAGVNLENMTEWFQAGACAVMLDDPFSSAEDDDTIPFDEKVTTYARKITKCFQDAASRFKTGHKRENPTGWLKQMRINHG